MSDTPVSRVATAVTCCGRPIELNEGRPRQKLTVRNTGDRPIQVGSHFHFFESQPRPLVRSEQPRSAGGSTFPPRRRCASSRATRRKSPSSRWGQAAVFGFNNLVDGWAATADADYRPASTEAVQRGEEARLQVRASSPLTRRRQKSNSTHDRRFPGKQYSPTSTGRRPATRSASATPTFTSRSRQDLRVYRRRGRSTAAARRCATAWARTTNSPGGRRASTSSSPTSRSSTPCWASSRPTSASRTARSSASARPATPARWTASPRASTTGPGTDAISGEHLILTAAGIDAHVHYHLARSRSRRALSATASPRFSAAASARPTAPTARPSPPAPGTSR